MENKTHWEDLKEEINFNVQTLINQSVGVVPRSKTPANVDGDHQTPPQTSADREDNVPPAKLPIPGI